MVFRTGTKIVAAFLPALMLLGVLAVVFHQNTQRMLADTELDHSRKVLTQIQKIGATTGYEAARHRGYLLTGDMTFLEPRSKAGLDMQLSLAQLNKLVGNDHQYSGSIDDLARLLKERAELSEKQDELRRSGRFEEVQTTLMSGKSEQLIGEIFKVVGRISGEERARYDRLQLSSKARAEEGQNFIIWGSVLAFVIVGAAPWRVFRQLRTLQRAEGMFRGLLESAPDAMVIMNQKGEIVRVNAQTERLFGYSRSELLNQPLQMLLPERFHVGHKANIARYLTAPEKQPLGEGQEIVGLKKDGEEFPLEVSFGPLESDEGLLISGAIRDITWRKRAEESLYRNERFRSAVLDALPAEVAVLDGDGVIVAVNEPWIRFGRENIGQTGSIAGVGSNYIEAARESAAANGLRSILNGETSEFRMEYPCDSPTEQRWFLMHAIAAPAEVGGAIVSHSDISERKKAEQALRANEELLRTVIAAIPDTVQVKDARGRWMMANDAALRHFDLIESQWLGQSDLEISEMVSLEVAENLKRCEESDSLTWKLGRSGREMERIPQTKGRERFFDVIKVPIWHPDGRPNLLVVVGRDVSLQKYAEEALLSFNSQLEIRVRERTSTLETAMTDLRREISERERLEQEILQISERQQMSIGQDLHDDLGQQLVGISMLAEILSNSLRAESHTGAKNAAQLYTYITQCISTTRNLAKSYFPVELERSGLLLALQDLADRTEQLSNVSCTASVDDDFHVEGFAGIHLYRIAQESITNAIKHGQANQIVISCKVVAGRRALSIKDNGTGFTPPREGQWSGMGLHLFQYRARLIGAEITVRCTEQGGCEVACILPSTRREETRPAIAHSGP